MQLSSHTLYIYTIYLSLIKHVKREQVDKHRSFCGGFMCGFGNFGGAGHELCTRVKVFKTRWLQSLHLIASLSLPAHTFAYRSTKRSYMCSFFFLMQHEWEYYWFKLCHFIQRTHHLCCFAFIFSLGQYWNDR